MAPVAKRKAMKVVAAKAKAKAVVKPKTKTGTARAVPKTQAKKRAADESSEEDEALSAALLAESAGLAVAKKAPVDMGFHADGTGGGGKQLATEEGDFTRDKLLLAECPPSPLDALASGLVPPGSLPRKLLAVNGITDLFLLPGLELKTLRGIGVLTAGERAMVKLVVQAAPKTGKGVDAKLFGQFFGDAFNMEAVGILRATVEGGQSVAELGTYYSAPGALQVGGAKDGAQAGRDKVEVVKNFTRALRWAGVLTEGEYHDMVALGVSRRLEPGSYRDLVNTEIRGGIVGFGSRLVQRCAVMPMPLPVKCPRGGGTLDGSPRGGGGGGKGGGIPAGGPPRVWDTQTGSWVAATPELVGQVCFAHIKGNCFRGRQCRFSHTLPQRYLRDKPGNEEREVPKVETGAK